MEPKYHVKQAVWYKGIFGRVTEITSIVHNKTITYLYQIRMATGEQKSVLQENLNNQYIH